VMAGVLHEHGHSHAESEVAGVECSHGHCHHGHSKATPRRESQPTADADQSGTSQVSAGHADCSICRFLGQRVLPVQPAAELIASGLVASIDCATSSLWVAPPSTAYSSRAPPLVG
jgi:hypothetical protein